MPDAQGRQEKLRQFQLRLQSRKKDLCQSLGLTPEKIDALAFELEAEFGVQADEPVAPPDDHDELHQPHDQDHASILKIPYFS